MRRLVLANGYLEVKTPLLFNKKLWEQSGHWGKYRENMFLVFDKESDPALPVEERLDMSLKPMNCPSHHLIYGMGKRTYRELPLRYFTVDVLHRNELSGSLGGLTRVRQFAQDDAHIYLAEAQIADEVAAHRRAHEDVYGAFGLEFSLKLLDPAAKPEDRIGDDALWDKRRGGAPGRARPDRPALGAQRRATARSTGRRSTSSSPTRSAASGRPARSSSTTPRRSASTSPTSATTTASTARW